MVVFTCNHCGESLQKPRVEKHYNIQCRKPKSLTCVDCFKDFKEEEYVVHTKCITEEERYAAKGSIPTGIMKKGEIKQESWTDMIKSIVDKEENMSTSLKNLFETISSYTNVPRKKNKFINFLKNSLGSRVHFYDVESAWDLIEKYKSDQSKSNGQVSSSNNQENAGENGVKHKLNGNSEEVQPKKKKLKENGCEAKGEELEINGNDNTHNGQSKDQVKQKKKKSKETVPEVKNQEKDEAIEQQTIEEPGEDVFSFKDTILSILKEKGNISAMKLQKKVLSKYVKATGNESTEKTIKKYNKKLKKIPNIIINDDVVSLQS